MSIRSLFSIAALVALPCASAHAGVITGQLRDSQGNPVPNAVFAFTAANGGGTPIVSGGFSNASGAFTTTITPDGEYRMVIYPLAPPASLVVTRRIDGIIVSPTLNNLGTQILQVGTSLTGRVVGATGIALTGVGLEFVAAPDFQPLDFINGDTDPTGHFTVSVPFGPCTMRFKPGPVPYYGGPDAAPTTRSYDLSGPTDAGDVMLPQGYFMTGSVVRASDGTPVSDAEVQVRLSSNGSAVYTPDNRTSVSGAFALTVAAGTYDVSIVPLHNDNLGSAVVQNRVFPPSHSLGVFALADSVELRGRVRDSNNSNCVGATVEVFDALTNVHIPVSDNVTDLSGHYRINVPTGTFNVRYSAPFTNPSGEALVSNLSMQHNTQQDADLPAVPFFVTVGNGTAGSGGLVPVISATGGTPRLGNLAYSITCTNAVGGAQALFSESLSTPPPAFSGGRISAAPWLMHSLQLYGNPGTPGAGSRSLPLPIADSSLLVGKMIRARVLVFDAGTSGGIARTNELRATIFP